MLLDGQILVIAFFAVALKLFLWAREDDVVGVDVELDQKDVLPLDDSGQGLREGAQPDAAEGIVATSTPRIG
jgi:hypothetical protein